MAKIEENVYMFEMGDEKYVVTRYYGILPNGDVSRGLWGVFHIDTGEMVDYNQYQHDLISKYHIKIKESE